MKLIVELVLLGLIITINNTDAQDELCDTGSMLVPNPYSCQLFYSCSNGVAHQMSCGIGTVFSRALQVCVKEDDTFYNDCVLERKY